MTHNTPPGIRRRTVRLANGYEYVRLTAACKNCGETINKRSGEADWMHTNGGHRMLRCNDERGFGMADTVAEVA